MKKIEVLTVNAVDRKSLVEMLDHIGKSIEDGEREGIGNGCKWWVDEKEVEE